MAPKKIIRKTKPTLLAVGEGHSEKAFLTHIKGLYSDGSLKSTILSASGKGPQNVLEHALRCHRNTPYDRVAVLMDMDIPWPLKKVQEAKNKGFILIGSDPCLEGLLLEILDRRKGGCNNECKELCHPLLAGPSTDRDSYAELFNRERLESVMQRMKCVEQLVNLFRA